MYQPEQEETIVAFLIALQHTIGYIKYSWAYSPVLWKALKNKIK